MKITFVSYLYYFRIGLQGPKLVDTVSQIQARRNVLKHEINVHESSCRSCSCLCIYHVLLDSLKLHIHTLQYTFGRLRSTFPFNCCLLYVFYRHLFNFTVTEDLYTQRTVQVTTGVVKLAVNGIIYYYISYCT